MREKLAFKCLGHLEGARTRDVNDDFELDERDSGRQQTHSRAPHAVHQGHRQSDRVGFKNY